MNTPSSWEIFWTFLKLGCTSFGGPIAHLGYFSEYLIKQRQWLTMNEYSSLVGLCHFIPGPSSSQVGLGIGYHLRGWHGALAAWLGFTLPSAFLMALVAIGLINNQALFPNELIHALKLIAIAVVLQAIIQMSQSLLPNWSNRILCLVCLITILGGLVIFNLSWIPYAVIALSGIVGAILLKPTAITDTSSVKPTSYKTTLIGLMIFIALFITLPVMSQLINTPLLNIFDSFYRTGATVFGGGHVVLPLMQQEVLHQSTITSDEFLTGYSLAQAVPGPLFTLASYIGALWLQHSPWLGATTAIVAIFLPSFIMVPSLLNVWQNIQHHSRARGVLAGCNAAVIGLLGAVLYQPLITSTVGSISDIAIILSMLIYLHFSKWPIWIPILLVTTGGIFLL